MCVCVFLLLLPCGISAGTSHQHNLFTSKQQMINWCYFTDTYALTHQSQLITVPFFGLMSVILYLVISSFVFYAFCSLNKQWRIFAAAMSQMVYMEFPFVFISSCEKCFCCRCGILLGNLLIRQNENELIIAHIPQHWFTKNKLPFKRLQATPFRGNCRRDSAKQVFIQDWLSISVFQMATIDGCYAKFDDRQELNKDESPATTFSNRSNRLTAKTVQLNGFVNIPPQRIMIHEF